MMRNDTARVTYSGETTAPNITDDCGEYPCDQHYVVRLDGIWWRAFHNERDARTFAALGTDFTNGAYHVARWSRIRSGEAS